MKHDPIVAEVRRVRDRLTRQFNYDIYAIFEDLHRRQGKTVTVEERRAGTRYPSVLAEPLHVRESK